MASTGKSQVIEYGFAARALPGQEVTGDRFFISEQGNRILIAVVDGLGHGREAAAAAETAVDALKAWESPDIAGLILGCDEKLRETRGVVMTVACLDQAAQTMSWIGIGNVEGVLITTGDGRPTRHFVLRRSGVVGRYLPDVRPKETPMRAGDTLILATDGIRQEFPDAVKGAEGPQRLADHLLARYGVLTDDALVLVARWMGADGA